MLRKHRQAVTNEEQERSRVQALEVSLDIRDHWSRGDPLRTAAKTRTLELEYRRKLDELERLVVQRIAELEKMNLAETGECTFSALCRLLLTSY